MEGHVVLCGLGKVGYSVLEILRGQNEQVVVITQGMGADWARRGESLASRLVLDDARQEGVLRDAEVQNARAIVICTNDDMTNLEIALDARRMSPDLAVVLRLFDPALAERVGRDLGLRAVLNSAALAAPAFVAAALGDQIARAFYVGNAFVHIVSVAVDSAATGAGATVRELAERVGATPLAVEAPDGAHTPASRMDRALRAGDRVVLAVTDAAGQDGEAHPAMTLGGARTTWRRGPRALARWVRPRVGPLAVVRRIWGHASPGMRGAFVALHILLILGVVVFHYAHGLTWIDALYFTVTTMTTVGFGDIDLHHASVALKLFGCLVMVSGAALLLVLYSIITDYLVTQRVEQVLGPRSTTLRDHVIVVGLGNLGHRVATRLDQLGIPVLAIERDADSPFVSLLPEGIQVLTADVSRSPKRLEQAGVASARAIVAATDDDLVNLLVAHHAQSLNPRVRTVVRLFNSSLAGKLGESMLGIHQALNPSQLAGATFAACALAPDVVQGFTLGSRLIMLRRLAASRLPGCVGRSVGELSEAGSVVVLLRCTGGDGLLRETTGTDVIAEGDELVVLEEYWPARHTTASYGGAALAGTTERA